MRKFLFAAWILASTTGANAGLIGSPEVTYPTVAGSPAGYTVYDIKINFDGQLFGQQMVVELTSGNIFQNTFGGNTAPNDALLSLPGFETLRSDSFVTIGGPTSSTSQNVLVVGGSTELGKNGPLKFDTTGVNIAWAPAPGVVVNGGIDFLIARLTLSNDAKGSILFFSSSGTGAVAVPAGTIAGGNMYFIVPEPTTSVLAGLALVGVAARRRV